jgi:hypothetical protein
MRAVRSVLLAVSVACAQTPAAFAEDCKEAGAQSVGGMAHRVEFPASGFSVLPPQGKNWCMRRSGPNGVVFRKTEDGNAAHTVVTMAQEVSVEEPNLDTVEGLRDFVERWLRAGGNTRWMGLTLVLDDTPLPRFKLIESRFDVKNPFAAICVGFDSVTEERGNRRFRDAVLIMVNRNQFLCRHPHARDRLLVLIGTSERYRRDAAPAGGLLLDFWQGELEPFVRSLRFSPVP